jgi:hypothetical protein
MTLHPTTALLVAAERRRDLETAAQAARQAGVPRPRRLRRVLRRAVPALSRTT